jgi:apolipoprotein N-acyltransferase
MGVEAALGADATVVALPEDARLTTGIEPGRAAELLAQYPHVPGALVIDSYRTDIAQYSSVIRGYVYDLDARTTYTEDKTFIVPVGEYLPWLHATLARLMQSESVFEHMTYVTGANERPAGTSPRIPSLLFCFESGATPIVMSRIKRNAADVIIHPVSHAWFHDPHTLWNQERQMLIVQSIYTGTPILQAGNRAPSALYLPDGTVDYGTEVASGDTWKVLTFDTRE